jgi:L-alanine-DL-glutamate epimerase-like enolase superfamily enzyme
VARGFKAIKMGWRPFGRVDRKTDELLVKTARETVGPDIELMVDAGGSEQFWPHGYKWALETAKMLADYDITWFEEALPPDDVDGYVELRRQSPVPIALTEAWRIGWMAYEHNILMVPHGWNTGIGLAADLHLTAALPIARYVEYLTPSPYLDDIMLNPFRVDAEGNLHVPTGPGLGIELNPEGMRKYGRWSSPS